MSPHSASRPPLGIHAAAAALGAWIPLAMGIGVMPAHATPHLSTADTITVYHADFETLSSPSNEGGWTHVDESGAPTAWHIAPTVACEGNALWCGIVDSSWTQDPDRKGYDNGWTQTATNFVDLLGAVSPFRIGFKHRLNLEPEFDWAAVHVFDPDDGWVSLATFTGKIPSGSALCDTFVVTIPDSIVAKTSTIQFRFVMTTDGAGSSSDGIYPDAEGWSIDNVTVRAGGSDLRFFDDMEAGLGTWFIETFPPVGDFWRVTNATGTQQLCTTNTSKAWTPTDPTTGSLTPRMKNHLISPPILVAGAAQIFLAFDVYRDLPFASCFYYGLAFRSRTGSSPWSGWIDPTGIVYFGVEREWLRQQVALAGASGAESLQVRVSMTDYKDILCDGSSTPGGTAFYVDNLDIRVIGLAGPSIAASETGLYNDTFRTTPFFGNDNFNTPRGDSVFVQIGASRGLMSAELFWSLNGAPFTATPLTAVGPGAPGVYHADVPAASYPRGTVLRYYFSATDSSGETSTLPVLAVPASQYFEAAILPGSFAPTAPCPGDAAPVLYVDAHAGPGGSPGMDQSLSALGVRYDRYDVNGAASGLGNTPGGGDGSAGAWPGASASDLAGYSAVIWDVGDRPSLTLSPQDQSLLSAWTAAAGTNRGLLLAGDNLAYDLTVNGTGVPNFLACTVGATYVRDVWETAPQDTLTPALTGAAGTRIAAEPFPVDGGCPGINSFDAIAVSSCAGAGGRVWLRYPNQLAAATERRAALSGADSVRVVLMASSFLSMTTAARRNLFLWRTLVEEMEVPYCTTPTAVEAAAAPPAPRAMLHPAAPNPFRPSTSVRFALPRPGRVRVAVYDVAGARVRRLADGPFPAGDHRLIWDGRDDRGREVGSAAYFIRMDGDGGAATEKVVLLR